MELGRKQPPPQCHPYQQDLRDLRWVRGTLRRVSDSLLIIFAAPLFFQTPKVQSSFFNALLQQ